VSNFLSSKAVSNALAPEQVLARAQWLEVLFIPLAAIGIAWLASPGDPLLANLLFPWLWLAPVLIALRYGVLPGLLASVPMLANWFLANHFGLVKNPQSLEFFFGGGVLVLVCGEFCDVWRHRNLRMEETYLYVTERLSRLTKRHLLVNLSHDRLEQEMLARPGSLRDALVRIRDIAIERSQYAEPLPGSVSLLQLLAQYVSIESAALYTIKPNGQDFVLGERVATLGEPQELTADDELFRLALESLSLTHIASEDVSLENQTKHLVVCPLIAGNDSVMGVLAVTRMPFFSLNVENLQMMSVILAYYADNIHHAPKIHEILTELPTMPTMFAEELMRLMRMQKKVGISSQIVAMTFGGSQGREISAEFLRIKRGLDLYWQTQVNGLSVVLILLPFASLAAEGGFVQRIEDWLVARFGGNFESLNIRLDSISFDQDDPLQKLLNVVKG
jgi:hypothetical protein